HPDAALIHVGLFLAGLVLRLHVRQPLVFQDRFLQVLFQHIMLTLHPHMGQPDEHYQRAGKDQAQDDGAGSFAASASGCHCAGTPAAARRFLRNSKQVDANHRSSKLLRAKPTATASCPGFCSNMSCSSESVGGIMRWNGFSTSTGKENSCRRASTRPGTRDDPPAR